MRGNIRGRCYFLNAAPPNGEGVLYHRKGQFYNRETDSQHFLFRITDARLLLQPHASGLNQGEATLGMMHQRSLESAKRLSLMVISLA